MAFLTDVAPADKKRYPSCQQPLPCKFGTTCKYSHAGGLYAGMRPFFTVICVLQSHGRWAELHEVICKIVSAGLEVPLDFMTSVLGDPKIHTAADLVATAGALAMNGITLVCHLFLAAFIASPGKLGVQA